MKQLLRSFGWSAGLSLLVFGCVLSTMGAGAGVITLVLAAIELSFSFDNAVINAKILTHLSGVWRRLFLSLGIIIAIFGVRALFPLLIVSLTARLPLGEVTNLAFNSPSRYAVELMNARPVITAFGGAFLLMLSLNFFLADREIKWLHFIERPLSRYVRWWLPLLVASCIVVGLSQVPGNQHRATALAAGLVGLIAFSLINGAVSLMNRAFGGGHVERVGWAALATFVYLELLDASLSFDGVIGAFAITNNVILIAAGLGIGAIWVRSSTVYMVKHRTLEAYKYLEHGAHYAITILAITMLLGVIVDVPDFLTGVLCLGLLAAAVVASRQALEAST